jgi:PIN domain nuclease of toxin-antitoxin system
VKLLLDTCTFLWAGEGREVSRLARAAVRDPGNEVFLSAVSTWEISIKHDLGRMPLPDVPERYLPRLRERLGFAPLALDEASTLHLRRLPNVHKDPFDRMLICQALVHGMTIVTPDPLISQYPVMTLW